MNLLSIRTLFALSTFACSVAMSSAQSGRSSSADLVLWDGNIYTLQSDDIQAKVQALAIKGERIVYAGTREGTQKLVSTETQIIELDGRTVLPGFTDAHIHPVWGGLIARGCDFMEAKSLDAICEMLSKYAEEHPEKNWIRGDNLDIPSIINEPSPRTILDGVVSDRPVYLVASGGHSAFVNSKALEMAGITSDSADPPQGKIGREPSSLEPSGVLFESAYSLVEKLLPKYTREDRANALRDAIRMMNSLGITNFVDAKAFEDDCTAYWDLAKTGDLSAHINLSIHAESSDGLDAIRDKLAFKDRLEAMGSKPQDLNVNQVKLFLDGTVEEKTAAMLDNYKGENHRGHPLADPETTNQIITALDHAGVQIHIHAIGDRAIRMALDGFEHARHVNGRRDSRHHIVHLNVVDKEDIPRFGALGVTANFSALWASVDEPYLNEINRSVLAAEQFDWQYPMGSIFKAGGRLVFGSDWPVSTANPFPAIQVAVTRRGPDHEIRDPWTPQHLIDVPTAIEGFIRGGAWITFREKEIGSLEPGKLADLVILSEDPFTISKFRLMDIKVEKTLFRGRTVFEREGATEKKSPPDHTAFNRAIDDLFAQGYPQRLESYFCSLGTNPDLGFRLGGDHGGACHWTAYRGGDAQNGAA